MVSKIYISCTQKRIESEYPTKREYRKIIDSKVAAGKGYVSSQEGVYIHIYVYTEYNTYRQFLVLKSYTQCFLEDRMQRARFSDTHLRNPKGLA